MACIINADNGAISGSAGVKTTADSTGVLNIQTNGTTAISISASQAVSFTNTPTFTGGTANGVLYLNGSKVATSGSALTFDGTNLAVGASPTFYGAQVATAGSISITGGNLLKLWNTGGTGVGGISSPGTDTIAFGLGASFTEGMRLTSTGLGIGTSSPTRKLQVSTAGNNYIASVNTSGSTSALLLGAESGQTTLYSWTTPSGSTGVPMTFYTGASEAMRLDSSGNLGIGTSSPAARVHAYSGTAMTQMTVDGTGAIKTGINFASSGTTYGQIYFDNNPPYDMTVFQQYSTGSLRFGTNNTERMRLDSSGNLGLGVTPSAWSTSGSYAALQIGAVGLYGRAAASNELYLTSNAFNSATGFKYIYTASATRYDQDTGKHIWYNAASGTAGNAISFTTAMTLDASGNLGVGITNPTDRLSVFIASGDSQAAFGNSTRTNYVGTQGTSYGALSTGDLKLYTTGAAVLMADNAAGIIKFAAGGSAERARITSGGDLCVGTTAAISVYGLIHVRGDNKGIAIQDSTDNSYRAIYNQSGNLYFYNGTNEGYLSTAGAWVDASDVRLKENIVPIKHGLDSVMKSQPRSYKMKDGNAEYVGFIAQEMLDVIPECVSGKPEKQLGISYGSLVAVTFKAIQEQQAMIMALKAELDQLKGVH